MKVKGWQNMFCAHWNQKKVDVTTLISDKIDFKTKIVIKDKDGNYMMIKGPIQEEDITLINIYACNIGSPKYAKQIWTDLKEKLTVI